MRGRAFWALNLGATLFFASAGAHAECTKDTDCKGDRVCEAGKCMSPVPVAAPPTVAPVAAPPVAIAPTTPAPAAATASLGPDEPAVRRRSRGAMVSGIIMVSVGPIALLGALAAKSSQDKCDRALESDYPSHVLPTTEKYRVDDCNSYSVPIYVFGIGGAALIAGGIPLIIYGSKNVAAQPTQPSGSLRVLPWAGPDSGGLKLRLEL